MLDCAALLMGFSTEEQADLWYAEEKEKLDLVFMSQIEKNKDDDPKHKEAYDIALKKLIAKYQTECERIVDSMNASNKKKAKRMEKSE